MKTSTLAVVRFLMSFVWGGLFFFVPVQVDGKSTVLFAYTVKLFTQSFPGLVNVYGLLLVMAGTVLTFWVFVKKDSSFSGYFKTSIVFLLLRVTGLLLAIMMAFNWGPSWLINKNISGLMWNTLVFMVAVIVPIGALFLNIFVSYGLLEFVGVMMRPLMKPLYNLPGRAALDDLMSWLGSDSVSLYLTRRLANKGMYNRREIFAIVTNFSTVSIGFVGTVVGTLGLLDEFPKFLLVYFFVIYAVALIMVRLWPARSMPTTYVAKKQVEEDVQLSPIELFKEAINRSLAFASKAPPFWVTAKESLKDGLALVATILPTIVSVGTLSLLVAENTSIFNVLSAPLIPLYELFGFTDAAVMAPATLIGLTEMYLPALLVRDASYEARFFIGILSVSQIVYFSSYAPMVLDMFRDVPIKLGHLLAIFVMRTLLLIPIIYLVMRFFL